MRNFFNKKIKQDQKKPGRLPDEECQHIEKSFTTLAESGDEYGRRIQSISPTSLKGGI